MSLFIFLIYLANIFNSITFASGVLLCMSSILFSVYLISSLFEDEIPKEVRDKLFKITLPTLTISILLFVFTPSKNVMYVMLGLYAGKEISLSETANRFSGKALDLLEKKLDEALGENDKK